MGRPPDRSGEEGDSSWEDEVAVVRSVGQVGGGDQGELRRFRGEVYDCFDRRADASFDLVDGICAPVTVAGVAYLALSQDVASPLFTDPGRLRFVLASAAALVVVLSPVLYLLRGVVTRELTTSSEKRGNGLRSALRVAGVVMLGLVFSYTIFMPEFLRDGASLALLLALGASVVLAALIGVSARGLDNNVLVQIGLVVLIGLAAKNAILIVEFARQAQERGETVVEAVAEACRLRLRPILMTAFAFILGVVPLVIATGPGAEMRRSLGTAVFSGMLGVTFVGLFLTPVFYVVLRRLFPARARRSEPVVESQPG